MKEFNMDTFNIWIQDNQDYSMITDKYVYVERKSNDAITYCTKVLGMIMQEAWIIGNQVSINEYSRLK